MPWLAQLRTSLAVWLSPLIAILVVSGMEGDPPSNDAYPLALTANATSVIFFLAPLCALCAAAEGARLRTAGWARAPHARGALRIFAVAALPVFAVGVGLLLVQTVRTVAPALPDPRVLAVAVAALLAWIALGYALGTRGAPVVVLPTVLLAGYAWMTVPLTLEPLWLRHLSGAWITCCQVDTDVSGRAVLGAGLASAGLAGTAYLLLRADLPSLRGRGVALAALPMVAGLVLGSVAVSRLGPDPVVPRTAAVTCGSGTPQVCVWPEHVDRLPEITRITAAATLRWRDAGVNPPQRWTERARGAGPGTAVVGFARDAAPADLISSLAVGQLPGFPACANTGPWLAAAAVDYLSAWLQLVAGTPARELAPRFGPETMGVVAAVAALPKPQQRSWFQANLAAVERCDMPYVGPLP